MASRTSFIVTPGIMVVSWARVTGNERPVGVQRRRPGNPALPRDRNHSGRVVDPPHLAVGLNLACRFDALGGGRLEPPGIPPAGGAGPTRVHRSAGFRPPAIPWAADSTC